MQVEIDYSLAFLTGILFSAHCIGMCGGLVSAFFMKFGREKGIAPYFFYHLSRISMYVLYGVVAAFIGKVLVLTGATGKTQGVLKILVGVIIIVLGLELLGISKLKLPIPFLPYSLFKKLFAFANQKGPVLGSLTGGILNGFMPCTLVFAMVVKSASVNRPVEGGLIMLAFGLGTLPSMLFVSLAVGKLSGAFRGVLQKGAAIFIIAIGIKTLYEGVVFNVIRT